MTDLTQAEQRVVDKLAEIIEEREASRILDNIGFKKGLRPRFEQANSFWDDVAREIKKGRVKGDVRQLLEEALKIYPFNDDLKALAEDQKDGNDSEVGGLPGMESVIAPRIDRANSNWLETRRFVNRIETSRDPDHCLEQLNELRRSSRDGMELFFYYLAVEKFVEPHSPHSEKSLEIIRNFYDHIPRPENLDLFRIIDTPVQGRIDLWRKVDFGAESFLMAAVPVTNAQYAAFDPSRGGNRFLDHPVVAVTWYEAVSFCRWLSSQFSDFIGARLPSEEEWEYASQDDLGSTRRQKGNRANPLVDGDGRYRISDRLINPVGVRPPNSRGLFDMQSQVWEWTNSQAVQEGRTGVRSEWRIIRGGSGWLDGNVSNATSRELVSPASVFRNQGFRVLVPIERASRR